MGAIRESEIEAHLRKRVREAGGWAPKWTSPGNVGVPDRMVLFPGGRVIFVEMKAAGKKPTAMQEVQHKRIRGLGHTVLVLDSKEAVETFIRQYAPQAGQP